MKRSTPLAFVAAAVFAALPLTIDRNAASPIAISAAQAAVDVNINVFFTSLAPHGAWIPSAEYNYIWVPTNVDRDWSPYSNGHWVYTDRYGWYFVSDEPFAWIVYHYGRWGYDPQIGWYWVPGTKFAGAWVAWRRGNNAVAWAPLPPQGTGYATSINVTINIGSVPQHYWRVVPVSQFLAPQLRTVAFAGNVRTDLFAATQPAGVVVVQNNIVVNNVININFIEQQTKQKVEVAKVEAVNDPQQATSPQATTGSTSVKAFVADLAPPPATEKPPKVVAKAEVQAPTKGQDQTAAATPAATPGTPGQPGAAPANPRCLDATFAKDNPKDCATNGGAQGNAAAGGNATVTPPASATPPANAANNAPGRNTPAPGGNAQGKATGNAAATTPTGPATGNANANANVTTPGTRDPRCTDATFAKNNPKTCAPTATVQGNAAAGANATVTPPAGATPPANTATNAPGRNTPATGNVQGNANAKAAATTPTGPATGNANANANVNANANATTPGTGDPRCADATFARNNPRACATTGNAPATAGAIANAAGTANTGPKAGATGNANAGVNASAPKAPATATGPAAPTVGAGGNVTLQGNSRLPDPRCADTTFARNNANLCRPAASATGGGAAGAGVAAPEPAIPTPAPQ
jgi:hypothetical protein